MKNNPKMTLKVGDKVRINNRVMESYGYTKAKPYAGDFVLTKKFDGEVGVIERINDEFGPSQYPSVIVKVAERTLNIDLCFLTKATKEKPVAKRAGAKKISPQCSMILKHLQAGHSITHRSALMDFGVMSLPRRICDLKELGHDIVSVMEHNKLTDQRYARYHLSRPTFGG